MHQSLTTLSHEPLVWSDSPPPGFKGILLPGGNLASATGPFGSICTQEFEGDQFTIRYNVLDILQDFVLKTRSLHSGIHTAFMIRGQAEHQLDNNRQWLIRQNQFSVLHAANPEITTVYNKRLHITFETFIAKNGVKDILDLFPSFRKLFRKNGPPRIWQQPFLWTDALTMDVIQAVLHCRYESDLRGWFFKARIRDIFFSHLFQLLGYKPSRKLPSEYQVQAAYAAEQIISGDIKEHYEIPVLARKVSLNENTFKKIFKKIFGLGPYKYLVSLRMKKAKELLEKGFSIKETAHQIGYRTTDFTSTFVDFYGYRPSAVSKKDS